MGAASFGRDQFTLDAKALLTGNLAGSEGLLSGAPALCPRLFVVYPDGHGLEMLDTAEVTAYLHKKYVDDSCRVDSIEVPGAEEPGTVAFTFITEYRPIIGEVCSF